ncbi:hypothetical protein [uncultured Draconibacterium sp.]|uniref:hypothetical protein n=1 Tax=uncultured Draconibacterium sp. TaxID=1573823 RepID=UPI0029C95ACC|nr:hypothetical protein [uncultured Draconibacterium sp.]
MRITAKQFLKELEFYTEERLRNYPGWDVQIVVYPEDNVFNEKVVFSVHKKYLKYIIEAIKRLPEFDSVEHDRWRVPLMLNEVELIRQYNPRNPLRNMFDSEMEFCKEYGLKEWFYNF